MAAKRPSKAERQRRNRAQREANRARSAHAGEATEIAQDLGGDQSATDASDAAETTDAKGAGSKRTTGGNAAAGKGRRRRENPFTIPGQRAVMLSLLFSIASIGLLIFSPVRVERTDVDADDPRVEQAEDVEENEDGTVNIIEEVKLLDEEALPVALLVMLAPVAITGAAVYFTKHEKRSTIWTMAMIGIAGYVFFIGGAYAIYTLPSLVALGVGGFQSRRAENKERVAELKAQRAARKEAKERGDVIDVDSVEEDD